MGSAVGRHPVSGRNARAAIGASLQAAERHNDAILELIKAVKAQAAILNRGFWGRLAWVVLGR
jgi:hypothetical protein